MNQREYEQSVRLLPVLDLMAGVAVAARGGDRDHYAPIRTPLTVGSDPVDVLGALLARCGEETVYVADLDAITGGGLQVTVLQRLLAARSGLVLWLDGGFGSRAEGLDVARHLSPDAPARVLPVLGTETLQELEDLSRSPGGMRDGTDCVLSLDFGAAGFRGDPRWWREAWRWPTRVIAMTLARVGAGSGPDLERLRDCVARADGREVHAAGGVRDARDLAQLAALGVTGALVATAVHQGRLPLARKPLEDENGG